jgi:hypothetical protein
MVAVLGFSKKRSIWEVFVENLQINVLVFFNPCFAPFYLMEWELADFSVPWPVRSQASMMFVGRYGFFCFSPCFLLSVKP